MMVYGDIEQDKAIDYLQKWFEANEKLPKKIDRIYLMRFYCCTRKNVSKTKRLLEDHFSMRHGYSNIFFNRDPEHKDTLNTAAFVHMLTLPHLTPDKSQVVIIALRDSDPKMMHFTEDIRTYIMTNDARLSMPDLMLDNRPLIAEGIIQIIDMNHCSMKHMTQLSFWTLRIFLQYLQQVCPVHIKGIHAINCKSYMNKMFAVVKPFIKKELLGMIHFHMNGPESLYDHIPRDILPEEYGGKAGTISDLGDQLKQSIRKQRDYLMDPDYWTIKNFEH